MTLRPEKPLTIAGDCLYLDTHSPAFMEALSSLQAILKPIDVAIHVWTFEIDPEAIALALSAGMKASSILDSLAFYSLYDIPDVLVDRIKIIEKRYEQSLTRDMSLMLHSS